MMLNTMRIFVTGFFLIFALNTLLFADPAKLVTNNPVSIPTPPANDSKPQQPDCTQANNDSRCRPAQLPYYDSYPHRARPVIINQAPAEPAVDINSLTDNWEGCRKAKLGSMHARDTGDSDQANHLDEWLWKNCRAYSNELRQLEQNDM